MTETMPRVVVIGCGFGGLSAAKALVRLPVWLTLIDRRNHHLFQPLLYQVATAGLSPADIAMPICAVFRGKSNTRVLLGMVTGIDVAAREVDMSGHRIGYDTLIVATGARHAYFGHDDWEPFAPGRVIVQPDLTLPGHPEIFVIGDTATGNGNPLPGLAPVAKQQGAYDARAVQARLSGREIEPFRYRNLGSLATIGRGRAVADFGWLRLSGGVAWLLCGLVHIAFLIGFRNRIMVLLQWLWSYVTFKRGARLTTGPTQSRSEYTNLPVVQTATAAIGQATSWASS